MRLLKVGPDGQLSLTRDRDPPFPRYAILSHTWGLDEDEVTLKDLESGSAQQKPGYAKIGFCADKAQEHKLEYIWVDSCCIDKANHSELSEAIVSMYRWYAESEKCIVYLADVSIGEHGVDLSDPEWRTAFKKSRWFTRGWTLQELLAPRTVEFFSREGHLLGSKQSLAKDIHDITQIPYEALDGAPMSHFSVEERFSWAEHRNTRKVEDKAYCLLGIFNVFMGLIYGEGENSYRRLKQEIDTKSGDAPYRKKRVVERVVDSLNTGSPFSRVNRISKSAEGTFSWIFNENRSDYPHEFVSWLKKSHGVFWIRGNPGSGKSTLMKYLSSDYLNHETMSCLRAWASPKDPIMICHYFWLADKSDMQSSFRGFCCHLLHQILSKQSAEFVSSLLTQERLQLKSTIDNWDEDELEQLLEAVTSRISTHRPLCFFIDGLDECLRRDLSRVIGVINAIVQSSGPNVKFCVSSRNEKYVALRLRDLKTSCLDLHTLTHGDIRRYVTQELDRDQENGLSSIDLSDKRKLVMHLVFSSRGVFLWAVLVARKMRANIELGDTFEQLWDQLNRFPRDMEDLYSQMLSKSGAAEEHRRGEVASYFKYMITHKRHFPHVTDRDGGSRKRMPFLTSALSTFVPLYEKYHGPAKKGEESTTIGRLRQRIEYLCEGFIEMEPIHGGRDYWVGFSHRTAEDFFQEAAGQSFLSQSHVHEREMYTLLIDGIFRNATVNDSDIKEINAHDVYAMVLLHRDMQEADDMARLEIIQYVDQRTADYCASKYGFTGKNWVLEWTKSLDMMDPRPNSIQIVDLTSLGVIFGIPDLLLYYLRSGNGLNQEYMNYMLTLIMRFFSGHQIPYWASSDAYWASNDARDQMHSWYYSARQLLKKGANPNAPSYWIRRDAWIRTSPWIQLISDIEYNYHPHRLSSDYRIIYRIAKFMLDNGANIDERTFRYVFVSHRRESSLDRYQVYTPETVFRENLLETGIDEVLEVWVLEVNAKWLLELWANKATEGEDEYEHGRNSSKEILTRDDVRSVKSHVNIIAGSKIKPGYHRALVQFVEIDATRPQGQFALALLRTADCWETHCTCSQRDQAGLCEGSSPVDIMEILEKRGFYGSGTCPHGQDTIMPMFAELKDTYKVAKANNWTKKWNEEIMDFMTLWSLNR